MVLRDLLDDPPRVIAAAGSLACLAIGGFLAWHHPIDPILTLLAFFLWSTAVLLRPVIWLFVIPALLPIIDLAPWTGWLIIEEFDILVIGAAAGAYASMAVRQGASHVVAGSSATSGMVQAALSKIPTVRPSGFSIAVIGLYGVWTAFGLYRGINAGSTLQFSWFDGYYDAANSLRIAKSYLLALLLLPPLLAETRRSESNALGSLAAGLTAGLGFTSLAILWERLAFPGLLNFSSDYRTTALFWETHVGGAALDGFLVLTLPFAFREVLLAPQRNRLPWTAAVFLLAAYACLTTFSRGVYLAVPLSLALLAMLLVMKGNIRSFSSAVGVLIKGCVLLGLMAALFYLVFRAGGYRTLLAVLGVFAVMLPLGASARLVTARGWFAAAALGVLVGVGASAGATFVPKGSYINFALAFACCALLIWRQQQFNSTRAATAALGAYLWLLIAAAGVALGWGGFGALRDTSIALLALQTWTIWNARSRLPLQPRGKTMQWSVIGVAVLTAATTAVFTGGAYVTDRFASTERDFSGRMQHWGDGMGMLASPADWLLGKGSGRFPASYLFGAGDREFPGASSLTLKDGERFLVLSGPRHESAFGELFRVTQHVQIAPGGHYSVVLDARASEPAQLHLELCERHLLYVEACAVAAVKIPATGPTWQRFVVALDGANITGGPWYAPRPMFFAMATESPQTRIEIDSVSLIGTDGRDVLANVRFAQGMAHWFTTSDRYHLPWHIKNQELNILFDQGIIGLLLFAMLTGGALFRLVAGNARRHPLAPYLAAALTGFLLVGLFDSLLDVPRVGFLFYLLVLASLSLNGPAAEDRQRSPSERSGA